MATRPRAPASDWPRPTYAPPSRSRPMRQPRPSRALRASPAPHARRAYASPQKPDSKRWVKDLRPPRQHQQRPTHDARKPGFTPGFAHFIGNFLHGITPGPRQMALAGRPAAQVCQVLMQVPLATHLEGRRRNAIDVKRQVAIAIDHMVAARRPVLREAHVVQLIEDAVHVRAHFRLRVTPDRDQAAGFQHAPRFGTKTRRVEPMIGLRNSNQVRAATWQAGLLSRSYKVTDALVRHRTGNLRFARITRHDRIEIPRQRHTRLPIPAARIPSQLVPMRLRS